MKKKPCLDHSKKGITSLNSQEQTDDDIFMMCYKKQKI